MVWSGGCGLREQFQTQHAVAHISSRYKVERPQFQTDTEGFHGDVHFVPWFVEAILVVPGQHAIGSGRMTGRPESSGS